MKTDDVEPLRHPTERWSLTGFEFRCVWEALGLDLLPFPIAYRHRQRLVAEIEADRVEALARQRAAMTQARVQILESLRFPAFMVTGFGRLDRHEGERLYRLFAVVGTTGHCAVITQASDGTSLFGEDVEIVGCANVDFPQTIVGALPDYRPGRTPRREARHASDTPAAVLGDAAVTGTILLSGSAEFSLGYDLRNPNHLTLIDVADDGAYLVNEAVNWFQIVPATAKNVLDAFRKVEDLQLVAAERLSPPRGDGGTDGLP